MSSIATGIGPTRGRAAPALQLLLSGGGVEIAVEAGTVSLTVTGSPAHDGTYAAATDALAAGPVCLKPPALAVAGGGAAIAGAGLVLTPGLWLYDGTAGTPALARTWRRDGSPIAGAEGTAYTVLESDAGSSIAAEETLAGAGAPVTAASTALALPGAAFSDGFESHADGTVLSDLGDYAILRGSGADILAQGGRAVLSTTSGNRGLVHTGTPEADHFAEIEVALAGSGTTGAGVYVRAADTGNYYQVYFSDSDPFLVKRVAGTLSIIDLLGGAVISDGDILRLEAEGSTLRVAVNGTAVYTGTDTALASGAPGLWLSDTDAPLPCQLDRFTCGAL